MEKKHKCRIDVAKQRIAAGKIPLNQDTVRWLVFSLVIK